MSLVAGVAEHFDGIYNVENMSNSLANTGIKTILNLLDEEEVMQLASTTTEHRLKSDIIKNKKDAVEIILRYSPHFSTILNRKSVKRDVLFQYLNDSGIVVYPPITKLALIQKILAYWGATTESQASNENKILTKQDVTKSNQPEQEVNTMATKFSEWFYEMMNKDICIGEEHFWQDCSMKLNLISNENMQEHSIENNSSEVTNLLFKTKQEHDLFFNPNLTVDGCMGKTDRHGLVLIFVCGTLHTKQNCVGVFEQMFTLARDPFSENNWKIKTTKMNLKSACVNEPPKLCNSDLNQELLNSPVELQHTLK